MNPFILLALTGGVLAVDERAGWQSLLSEPVFTGLLVGLLTGQMEMGLSVGLGLQLVWLSIVPLRGTKRPDQVSGGVVGAGTAALLAGAAEPRHLAVIVPVAVLTGLLAGEAAARLSPALYRGLDRALCGAGAPGTENPRRSGGSLRWLHAASLAYILLAHAALVFVLLRAGHFAAMQLTTHLGDAIRQTSAYWQALLPAFGAAAMVRIFWYQQLRTVLALSAVAVFLLLWFR